MRANLAVALGILISAPSGCASISEFRALEREVVELKRTRNAPTDQQQRLADLGVEARELRQEVARLQDSIERLEFAFQQVQAELEARGLDPGAIGGPGPGPLPGGALPDGAPGVAPPVDGAPLAPGGVLAPPPAAGGPGASPTTTALGAEVSAYEGAFRLYRAGEYGTAIAKFRDFLQAYPDSEYADNALFWLGECYFKEGDFAKAAVTFEDVAKKYPEGNKVPDALYRQGLALLEIGGKNDQRAAYQRAAREIFQKILDIYPDSERAFEARRQLEKLGT